MVDFALDKLHPNQGRGFAYVEFETADEAENAMKHMDGGKARSPLMSLDGLLYCHINARFASISQDR